LGEERGVVPVSALPADAPGEPTSARRSLVNPAGALVNDQVQQKSATVRVAAEQVKVGQIQRDHGDVRMLSQRN
jgi:hypothetical protein